jgi:hypothetical protein
MSSPSARAGSEIDARIFLIGIPEADGRRPGDARILAERRQHIARKQGQRAAWRMTEILDAYKIARLKWETCRFAIAKKGDKGPDSASH